MDYSHLVHDLEHIKQQENAARVHQAFDAELFSPITVLMRSAVEKGEIKGDAKFLAHLFMGIIENYIARAVDFGNDNKALAKKLVAFFLRGAR